MCERCVGVGVDVWICECVRDVWVWMCGYVSVWICVGVGVWMWVCYCTCVVVTYRYICML